MHIGLGIKIVALAIAVILLLPVGSIEDRSIVVTILLISRITAVRLRFKRLQEQFGVDAFRCLLLSVAWIVWAWGNARARSESQVVGILGKSTSVENVGPFRTLFYRGNVPGSGSVSGNIKLTDDRVWQINKPVF